MTTDQASRLSPARARAVDWFERLAVAVLFTVNVVRASDHLDEPGQALFLVLFAASEGVVVALILVRRPTDQVSLRIGDWLVAIGGTMLPQLVQPGGDPLVPAPVVVALVVGGMCVQIWAKLVLRRSFGMVAANRGVKSGGPYRLVRHPMYAGYFLSHVGLLLLSPLAFNLVLYLAVWTCQVLRIRAEERVLSADGAYVDYTARVHWRVVPGVY